VVRNAQFKQKRNHAKEVFALLQSQEELFVINPADARLQNHKQCVALVKDALFKEKTRNAIGKEFALLQSQEELFAINMERIVKLQSQ